MGFGSPGATVDDVLSRVIDRPSGGVYDALRGAGGVPTAVCGFAGVSGGLPVGSSK